MEVKVQVTLLEKVTATYSLEMEQKNKFAAMSRTNMVRVAAVSEEHHKTEQEGCTQAQKNKIKPTQKSDIQTTTQITVCNQAPRHHATRVSEWPQKRYQPQPGAANTRRCRQCEASKPEGKCGHCYKCGSDEHWVAGCHKKTSATVSKIETLSYTAKRTDTLDQFNPTTPLTGKQQQAANLVGKRCLVRGSLNGVCTTVLWDCTTGSQVSIVEASWNKKYSQQPMEQEFLMILITS